MRLVDVRQVGLRAAGRAQFRLVSAAGAPDPRPLPLPVPLPIPLPISETPCRDGHRHSAENPRNSGYYRAPRAREREREPALRAWERGGAHRGS
jgi:hypothetical protein